jgi:long-chain fatty acid transport protein
MMRQIKRHCLPVLVAIVTAGLPPLPAHSAGFDLPDQDAFVVARGMAFAATADNPSAIYYNPAGITQLTGSHVRAGVYAISLEPTYRSPDGRRFHNQEKMNAVPQLFVTHTPDDSAFSFGLGLYSPFGLSMQWPQDTGFRTIATEGALKYITANPVLAWKIAPNLSVAAGVTFNYAEIDLQQGLVWPEQPFDRFKFKGDGWDVGYNLGALWHLHEKVAIGATFRSATRINLKGQTEFHNDVELPLPGGGAVPAFPRQRVDAEADFPFPLKVISGISFRPTPEWNFEFNADYTGWNALRTVTLEQAAPFPPLLPQDVPLTLNWQSSWYYEFGATRYFNNGWHVSAGYIFNENSVPDANYTPLVADLDRHFWSVGTGFRGRRLNFDVAYQFGYGPTRTVTGSAPSPTGQTADGRYSFLSHAVALSAGWQF